MQPITLEILSLVVYSLLSYLLLFWWIEYKSKNSWIGYTNFLSITWVIGSFLYLSTDLLNILMNTESGLTLFFTASISIVFFTTIAYMYNNKHYKDISGSYKLIIALMGIIFVIIKEVIKIATIITFNIGIIALGITTCLTIYILYRKFKYISFVSATYIAVPLTLVIIVEKWLYVFDPNFSVVILLGAIIMCIIGFFIFFAEYYYFYSEKVKEDNDNKIRSEITSSNREFYLTYYDSLTKLKNKKSLIKNIEEIKNDKLLLNNKWIIMINIKNFSKVNNYFGYNSGNEILKSISNLLLTYLDKDDSLYRFENDVFAIIHDGTNKSIDDFYNKIFQEVNKKIFANYDSCNCSLFSFATEIKKEKTFEQLIQELDSTKLFSFSNDSCNFYKENYYKMVKETINLQGIIKSAIENKSFLIHYQPKVDIKTKKIIGAEALVRLQDNGKIIHPFLFIPLAEETGLINQIGIQVIENAFIFSTKIDKNLKISINLSPVQLFNNKLIFELNKLIVSTNVVTTQIIFEVTETAMMSNYELGIKRLYELKDLGFSISLDDFGTGYSSFSYLIDMPISEIKIDKSLLNNLSIDKKQQYLIKALSILGKDLNLDIVVEGIETTEQLQIIRKFENVFGQGYLFYKPMEEDKFLLLLE